MPTDEEIFLENQSHIKEICDDVTGLVENQYVFDRFRVLLKPNEEITNNVFFDHYILNYVSTMVSGVRRQIDRRTSLGGLRKLLENMETHPDFVTKERFLRPYKASGVPMMDHVGEGFWNEKYGGGDILDVNIIKTDLALLDSVTLKLKDFVDKRIAHKDKEWADYELTYGELDRAIEVLEELTIKYRSLLTGDGFEKLLPTFHYDWEEIFNVAWVK
jgi:hypothetical protein